MTALVCPIHTSKELTKLGSCVSCRKRVQGIPRPETAPSPVQPPLIVATPEPVSTPKRRGRPPKFGVAMTVAERQAASRAWRKEKHQDVERRNLVAEILKIYRRELSWAGGAITVERESKIYKANKHHLRSLHNELLNLSIEELQAVLDTKKNNPDSEGRLHNERSGQGPQKHGQTEIERILGLIQHDTTKVVTPFWANPADSVIDDDEELTRDTAKQMAAGFRGRPEGAGPASYDPKDSMDDEADAPKQGAAKPKYVPTATDKRVTETIQHILMQIPEWAGHLPKLIEAKCPFCSETFSIRLGMENHLESQYGKGKKQAEKHLELIQAAVDFNAIQLPGHKLEVNDEPQDVPYTHYKAINSVMKDLRKAARKKPA